MNKILFFIIVIIVGCSHNKIIDYKTISLAKNLEIRTNHFLDIIPKNSKIVQLVTYTREAETKKAQVIFVNRDALRVTVLSPMGVELLSLRVTDKNIKRIGGIKQFKIDFFYKVMADMLAVYGPKKLLYTDIIGKVTISESRLERTISDHSGKAISINFDQTQIWKSNVSLEHHQLGYKLNIKTLAFKNESIHQ